MGPVETIVAAGDDPTPSTPPGAPTVEWSRALVRSDLRAVGEVRRDLREVLRRHRCRPEAADVAELLTTELVTNALVHTDEGAGVTARIDPDGLRVEVRDRMPHLPRPLVPSADDGTHGRGLVLVEALADAWGVEPQAGGGKVVWFELRDRARSEAREAGVESGAEAGVERPRCA
ncbi:ATP-binding protein [Streptomyces sp. BI20]|uniref:ATP-binding protein n=1 Tax=Streptomyces sp. BI20 TaxID=3403460 RepID=UPI003C743867